MDIFNDFNTTQLDILGFTKEYRLLFLFVCGLFILFFVIKPCMHFLGKQNYFAVLTYVVSTMMVINVSLVIALVQQEIWPIKIGLESVALYGLFYVLFLLYRKLVVP
jgi:hypothetical protein